MHELRLILLASALALLMPAADAQSLSDLKDLSPEDRRAYMHSMSPEERDEMRKKWRSELDAMSDEERQAFRESMAANRPQGSQRRHAMRERWESMSDEERAAARERRQERAQQRREKWESMTDEERAAAREKRGHHRKGGKRDDAE